MFLLRCSNFAGVTEGKKVPGKHGNPCSLVMQLLVWWCEKMNLELRIKYKQAHVPVCQPAWEMAYAYSISETADNRTTVAESRVGDPESVVLSYVPSFG